MYTTWCCEKCKKTQNKFYKGGRYLHSYNLQDCIRSMVLKYNGSIPGDIKDVLQGRVWIFFCKKGKIAFLRTLTPIFSEATYFSMHVNKIININ